MASGSGVAARRVAAGPQALPVGVVLVWLVFQRPAPIARAHHLKPLVAQAERHQLRDVRLVIDDQYAHTRSGISTLRRTHAPSVTPQVVGFL